MSILLSTLLLATGFSAPAGTDSVSGDSLYWRELSQDYLYVSAKTQNPTLTARTPMTFMYGGTVSCMDPTGDYVWEVYNTYMRKYSTVDGSYTQYPLWTVYGNGACGTDGNYIYIPSGMRVYKVTKTGDTSAGCNTLARGAGTYAFSVVNDTIWTVNTMDSIVFGYACSRIIGNRTTISPDDSWNLGAGTGAQMNIAFDGTYYYVTWGFNSTNTFKRFNRNRTLYSTGTVNRNTYSVMARSGSGAVHDVGVVRLIGPIGLIDSGTTVTPACSVYNYGTGTETFTVRMKIGAAYNQTATVASLAPGARAYATFTSWTALPRGNLAVSCSTELNGDVTPSNDKRSGTITVVVRDAECVSINAPTGAGDSATAITPQGNVRNNGTANATFDVVMTIGSGYANTQTVTGLAPGASQTVNFAAWTPLARGAQATKCSTRLTSDMIPANDFRTGTFFVNAHDAGTRVILAPAGIVGQGTVVTPACSVYNYGNVTETGPYTVRMKIGSSYNSTAVVSGHTAGTCVHVTFPTWTATTSGTYPVSCSTELVVDGNRANDKLTGSVTVNAVVHDVGAIRLIRPIGLIDSGIAVAPACSVYNFGNQTETFNVRLKIGAAYNSTAQVTGLASGARAYATFTNWTALPRGSQMISCSTELGGDAIPTNDRVSSAVFVEVRDLAAISIVCPQGQIPETTVVPCAVVRNNGTGRLPAVTRFWIVTVPGQPRLGSYYDSLALPAGLPVGVDTTLYFPPWVATPEWYGVRCEVFEPGDMNPGNDNVLAAVHVGPGETGWVRKADVPMGAKAKRVKDGGCLACSGSDLSDQSDASDIYCLKGNNRCEFYEYNIATNTWATKESIPAFGRSGKKKAVKKGGTLAAVGGKIYATKGNSTVEFWRYQPTAQAAGRRPKPSGKPEPAAWSLGLDYPWTQMADVPLGARTVKEGAGAAAVTVGDTTFVYLLKGSSTSEFYRYNVGANSWQQMANAPTGVSGKFFKNGSCITNDGAGKIYALKGSYNELYAYDVAGNTWLTKATMPFIGASGKKKKAKDGAGIAAVSQSDRSDLSDGSDIYCLKGGNTQEFWTYQPDSDKWVQKPDMPIGGGKKVKNGGALVYASAPNALFALKGNNTFEFWKYGLSATTNDEVRTTNDEVRTTNDERRTTNVCTSTFALSTSPNPFTNATTISYTLPGPGTFRLSLYDVAGKLVTTLSSGYHNTGALSFVVCRSSFASGIYLLKLETDDAITTAKLIIE